MKLIERRIFQFNKAQEWIDMEYSYLWKECKSYYEY